MVGCAVDWLVVGCCRVLFYCLCLLTLTGLLIELFSMRFVGQVSLFVCWLLVLCFDFIV